MANDRMQGEGYKNTNGAQPGEDNVVELDGSRIVAVQGQTFYREFLAGSIQPMRREVAMMALNKLLEQHPDSFSVDRTVEVSFQIADAFCLQEAPTLEAKVGEYFDLYMKKGKLDEILKAHIDASKDYSA